MQELRLAGVHEDGEHLLLSGEQDATYSLPIDPALRAAASGTAARQEPGSDGSPAPARQKQPRPPVPLTPRDIQARIRAGATAEQVAADSGVELASVRRYEGPVRAERDYVAYLAQRVEVATPIPSHDGYRSAFGDEPALLGDMVAFRVQSYGVDPASLDWDSWRRPDGSWHVEASFDLPGSGSADLGEEPPAHWIYNPTRKTVVNGNRWAQVLSELEPLDGPLPARRLSAVADRVADVETEHREEPPAAPDTDGLLDVLRSRRGQRLGADEEGDDALAELLTRSSMSAAPPRADTDGSAGPQHGDDTPESGDITRSGLSLAPRSSDDDGDGEGDDDSADGDAGDAGTAGDGPAPRDDRSHGPHDGGDGTSVISAPDRPTNRPVTAGAQGSDRDGPGRAAPGRPPTSGTGSGRNRDPEGGPETTDPEPPETGKDTDAAGPERRIKPKRSSVPSWDDIVFGRRGD